MCTHLTETKSEKKSLNVKRNGKNFDVLQTSSFKRVGSTGSFDDYGESFWCLYTTKTMKILFLFRLPDFFLPVSMGLSIYWKSVWSHHQKLQRVVVQVTISLRFLDQTKLQTWEPVSMDDNGMLFTVFQNRMHLAIIVFWEKNPENLDLPVWWWFSCLTRIRVSRKPSLKEWCFWHPWRGRCCIFLISRI